MSVHPDRPGRPGRGLLVVQIDGLSRPILERLLERGKAPVIAGLIGQRELTLADWHPLLPPCTPASQAGILHGRDDGIPGFRWYEKGSGRMIVANRARDAAEIARRISRGDGLLVGNGASVGNLLTGDAVASHLTLATIEGDPTGFDRSARAGSYPLNPLVYGRIVAELAVEIGRESVESARNGLRGHVHRPRGLRYAFERVIANVPLRVLSAELVIREMKRGRSIVYVDFTGYDETAHHTGPDSPASHAAASRIDRTIGRLLKASRRERRVYDIVILSDHGQSAGATFSARFGVSLEELVASYMGSGTRYHGATLPTEYDDSISRLAGRAGGFERIGRLAARAVERTRGYNSRVGTAGGPSRSSPSDDPASADVVVAASGNLALVAFPGLPGRPRRDELDRRWPSLVDALVHHPGVGIVVVASESGPVAIGAHGRRLLESDQVEGDDPTSAYGPHAAEGLRRVAGFENSGDLILVGALDARTDEVVSFEELIGSHGGLGGWQVRPFIMHPPNWELEVPLVGAPALYRQLRSWMAGLGTTAPPR
jgi:hypothetical protein